LSIISISEIYIDNLEKRVAQFTATGFIDKLFSRLYDSSERSGQEHHPKFQGHPFICDRVLYVRVLRWQEYHLDLGHFIRDSVTASLRGNESKKFFRTMESDALFLE
jgi:hypothetical protein